MGCAPRDYVCEARIPALRFSLYLPSVWRHDSRIAICLHPASIIQNSKKVRKKVSQNRKISIIQCNGFFEFTIFSENRKSKTEIRAYILRGPQAQLPRGRTYARTRVASQVTGIREVGTPGHIFATYKIPYPLFQPEATLGLNSCDSGNWKTNKHHYRHVFCCSCGS